LRASGRYHPPTPAQRIRQEPRSENQDRQREIEDVTRVVLRPLASPLPLAFLAFGVGSAIQSALQLGLIPQSESANLALVFGALAFPPLIRAAIFTATLHSAWLSDSKTWSTESLYLWSVAAMRPWPSRAT